jgi:hypothetical protein
VKVSRRPEENVRTRNRNESYGYPCIRKNTRIKKVLTAGDKTIVDEI